MSAKNILKEPLWQWKVMEYLSYITVFLVPLFFIDNHFLFSFSAPKTILIIGLILLMLIFYLLGILNQNKLSFRFTPIHIVLGVFLAVLTISSIFGVDPLNSFFGRWIDGINMILIYAVAIFALFVGFLIKKNKLFLSRILLASFVSGIIVAFISYFESNFFTGSGSTLGNSSYTGAYLLFNVCFGIGLFLNYSKIWQKILIAVGFLLIIISPIFLNKNILLCKVSFSEVIHSPFLLFGQANAATIGLGVSFLVIFVFFLIFSSKKITKIIGVIFLLSILFGSLFTGLRLVNPTSSLHHIYLEAKNENRFVTWDMAQSSISAHPLLGSGFNNFSYTNQKYFSNDILKEGWTEFYFLQPHNVIWEYASNNGGLGLLSFFALLALTFFALFKTTNDDKKERNIRIILIGTLFGYFIQNLFGFDTPATYLILFLLIGIAVGLSKKEWIFSPRDKVNGSIKIISSLFVLTSFASMVLFVVYPVNELNKWGKIISTEDINQRISDRAGIQGTSLFGGVYDDAFVAGKFYNLYARDINNVNDSNRDIYAKEIQSVVDQVESDVLKQPNDVYPHIILNSLLNMEFYITGKTDMNIWNQSYGNAKIALALNPQNPETYLQLAQTYILKEDFSNAYISLRQAIVIAPSYTKSYDYARKILKLIPNKSFEKFVNDMEKKWVNLSLTN